MTYIETIINGFCTGCGVAVAYIVIELWIKPFIKKFHKSHLKFKKFFKNYLRGVK